MVQDRCLVILEPVSKRVSVARGTTVYQALIALNHPFTALCGGAGICGKCKIKIADPDAKVSPPTESEVKLLGKAALDKGFRLACQTAVEGDIRVLLTDALLPRGSRILTASDLEALGIDVFPRNEPIFRSRRVVVKKPTIQEPVADVNRLFSSLGGGDRGVPSIDSNWYVIARLLPSTVRAEEGVVTVFEIFGGRDFDEEKVVDVVPGDHPENYGLAIDIGTTTIVGYLHNLENGELAAISAMLNPQVAIGEDVVSRMTYVQEHNDGLERARTLVVGALNEIIHDTCQKASISPNVIRDVVFVGNTTMHHLFLGLPTRQLGLSPFVPVFKAPINIPARDLGLECNPMANVYSPPVVAGYVGTDTVGCMISARMDELDHYSLLIDIGTNGELALGNREGLITGSCAAGSALEGAEISCGMRAARGAIESVKIEPGTLVPTIGVIGDVSPIGVCGSGLIDLTAEMLRAGIITRRGRFNIKNEKIKNHARIVDVNGDLGYVLYDPSLGDDETSGLPGDERSTGRIIVTQEDIRQIQLAKGAFLSGALLLLEGDGKSIEDLERVILAGAFGSYINKENAMFIGLYPEVPVDQVFQIGNAAGLGAQLCLKNKNYRQYANEIAFKARYHEISTSPRFQLEFAYSLYFPHKELDYFPTIKEQYEDIPFK